MLELCCSHNLNRWNRLLVVDCFFLLLLHDGSDDDDATIQAHTWWRFFDVPKLHHALVLVHPWIELRHLRHLGESTCDKRRNLRWQPKVRHASEGMTRTESRMILNRIKWRRCTAWMGGWLLNRIGNLDRVARFSNLLDREVRFRRKTPDSVFCRPLCRQLFYPAWGAFEWARVSTWFCQCQEFRQLQRVRDSLAYCVTMS